MPQRVGVKDRNTGFVRYFDWNQPRDPTYEEAMKAADAEEGFGQTINTPNQPQPSMFSKAMELGGKITGTMWGGEKSVLPPVPGITRPLLPEASDKPYEPTGGARPTVPSYSARYMQGGEQRPIGPIEDLYNALRSSSSVVGAASDYLTGKATGAIAKPIIGAISRRIPSGMFSDALPAVETPRPISRKPIGYLPERTSPRFVAGPEGIAEAGQATSIQTGDVIPQRRVHPPIEPGRKKGLSPTLSSGESRPFVDIPTELQAAYPNVGTPPPAKTPSQIFNERSLPRQYAPPDIPGPTEPFARPGPITKEYVGRPLVGKGTQINPMDATRRAAEEVVRAADDVSATPAMKSLANKITQGPNSVGPPSFSQLFGRPIKEQLLDIANLPRSIMSSIDLSAPLRQGAPFIGRKQFWTSLDDMVKSAGSEEGHRLVMQSIESHPLFETAKRSGLALTDVASKLAGREEQFMSSFASKIPLVRASERAYTGYLNKLRFDTFADLAEKMPGTDPKEVAKFINNFTGRGSLGKYEGAAPALNAIFFSPRLMASRVNMMNPITYAKMPASVRKEALKSLVMFGSGVGTVLGLAKASGADIETDPRSSDFAKIKVGNTRFDVGAGFQQYIRAGAQLAMNERKSPMTGKITELGQRYGADTRADVALRFLRSKLSPVPSMLYDLMEGKDFAGQPVTVKSAIANRLQPMIIQDLMDLYRDNPDHMAYILPGIFGVGVQTYDPYAARSKKRKPQ